MVKLVLSWDIQSGKADEYVEFIVGEFAPALDQLGLNLSDAWYTQAGTGPQIVIAGWLPTAEAARQLISSQEFLALKERLFHYIDNYAWRIDTSPQSQLPF